MFDPPDQDGRPSLFVWSVRAVAASTLLAVFAAQWLAEGSLDQKSLSHLAAQASRKGAEPTMTGSITRAASALKLDPCGESRRP